MQQILAVRLPLPGGVLSRPILNAFSSQCMPNRARGGLPRFHSQTLPSSKGEVVRVRGDEFWHMAKVLRLGLHDRVELFNGEGGVVEGSIQNVDKNGLDVMALEDPKVNAPKGTQWHVYAAFGNLKGGRSDWLLEKCTELGASSVTPLLTERSPTIGDNRVGRLQRVILAAVKQCQRLHGMTLNPATKFHHFLPIVARSKISLLATAEASPVLNVLSSSSISSNGLIIIGPEGGKKQLMDISDRENVSDFTDEEVELMIKAGATPIGLGPCRLRVETAAIALLSTVMLWSDAQDQNLLIYSVESLNSRGGLDPSGMAEI